MNLRLREVLCGGFCAPFGDKSFVSLSAFACFLLLFLFFGILIANEIILYIRLSKIKNAKILQKQRFFAKIFDTQNHRFCSKYEMNAKMEKK